MAEEKQLQKSDAPEESADVKQKGGMSKKLLVIGAILLLIAVEVGVSYYLNKTVVVPQYFSKTMAATKKSAKADSTSKREDAELNSNIYMLDNVVINPTGTNGTRYVSLSIGLGVLKASILEDLKARDIQIRDTVNSLLAKKSMGEFVDIDKRNNLKKEIMVAINDKIQPEQIRSIYFTEFVIQ